MRTTAELIERVCEICGKTFLGYKNRRYCGKECAKEGARRKSAWEREARKQLGKVCAVCGKEFFPAHRLTKTCSDECRAAWESKRRGASKQIGSVAKCDECGKEYVVLTANARYCSAACKKRANHRQTAQEYKAIHAMQPPQKRRAPALLGLEAVAREAVKHGLTYGQYVARMEAGEL